MVLENFDDLLQKYALFAKIASDNFENQAFFSIISRIEMLLIKLNFKKIKKHFVVKYLSIYLCAPNWGNHEFLPFQKGVISKSSLTG